MFDSLKSIISGLNIFDLREPAGFRFYSIHGFAIYLVSYAVVVIYDSLFTNECITAITTGWQSIAGKCGLTAGAIIYPFIYMGGAFVIISLAKKADWSADAIFNNLSLLIVTEAIVVGILYQLGLVQPILNHPLRYFIALSLIVLSALSAVSISAERHSRPPKWTLAIGLGASPGIYRLLVLYFVLSAPFYLAPIAAKYGLSPSN